MTPPPRSTQPPRANWSGLENMKVRFVSADGNDIQEIEARPGDRLLDVAQAAGQPLEGTCEGQMACSTCHVIVAPEDFGRLPRASVEEDDLLDLAARVTRTSRLACQIWLEEALDGLTVRIPPEARNMQGR
jgi:ferredoxin